MGNRALEKLRAVQVEQDKQRNGLFALMSRLDLIEVEVKQILNLLHK